MEKGLVVDASALLAVYFKEPGFEWVVEQLKGHPFRLISPLTVTEVLIRVRDRDPESADAVEQELLNGTIRVVDMDTAQAVVAAKARHEYPLNLGDCVVYALAKTMGAAILTLDQDFKNCDVPVLLPPKA